MEPLLLTIAIPTFSRVHLLRQTVELLLPQLRDGVELLVCDNCSTDGTAAYLQALHPRVRHHRHPENIGSDPNFFSCLTLSRGQYTWILCDDDLPCSNTVDQILRARAEFKEPGLIYLRGKSDDIRVSTYTAAPVHCGWAPRDRNSFLEDIGVWVTFGSSIVVRRDGLDMDFLKRQFGTFLLSASITLQAAGTASSIVVSEQPLLYVRGGNSGGYDALMVFSKNFWHLLTKCRQFGYSQKAVEAAYQNSLVIIIPGVIEVWPLRAGGLCDLFWHTRNHAILYTKFIPLLARRFKKYLSGLPYRLCWGLARRMVRSFAARFGAEMHAVVQEVSQGGASKQFQLQVFGAHPGASVRHPIYLKNPKYLEIGMGFVAQPGLRIEAWDEYGGEKFRPVIKIGNRVSLNWNVHIGAIDRIEIGDDVLIGSNVLITDHFHGSAADLALTPASRPLKSKGPVIIEANVLIGEGVCILPNVRIGKGAVIGANAVVTADVPAGAVMGGVPARVINRPDTGHPAVPA